MTKRFWFLAFAALFVFCGNVDVEAQYSRRYRTEETRDVVDEEFVEQQFAFALNLYRRALECDEANANVLVAPFSVCRCLNALSTGSAGETKAEIDAALGRDGWSDKRWSETLAAADRRLNDAPEATLAGALWFAPDLKLDATFVERCEKMSQTEASTFDFKAPDALKTANDWFEKNTNGKIKDFLSKLAPDTRLLVADATTFKASWERGFDEFLTKTRYFTNAQGEKIPVATMTQTSEFRYYEARDFQYLEAPYEGGRFALAIVLPKKGESLAEVERFLTPRRLLECRDFADFDEVEFRLPKFKVERSFDLGETLRKAGVVAAFEDAADFTPATAADEEGRRENLKVNQAKQAAFISVDENGTEAAAATAFMMVDGSPMPEVAPPPPPKFYADRPFFYFIYDAETGAVLFAGRLVDPEPSGKAEDAERAEKADARRTARTQTRF